MIPMNCCFFPITSSVNFCFFPHFEQPVQHTSALRYNTYTLVRIKIQAAIKIHVQSMKLFPLITRITECMYWRMTVHARMTMPQAVYLMVLPFVQKWFNWTENGNDRQNFKNQQTAFKIFAIMLHPFQWLTCFKCVIADHGTAITLHWWESCNEHDIVIFSGVLRLSLVDMFQ